MTIPLVMRGVRRAFPRSFGRPPVVAVAEATCEVGAGEIICLVGAARAGKTTLLRLAAGVERPDAGTVRVAGVSPDRGAAREIVGLAPQHAAFPPAMTVRETLDYFARHHARAVPRAAVVRDALEMTGLGAVAERRATLLPLAESRLLLLAQAALGGRRLLLLDEPFTGLDAISRRDLGERLQRLAAAGASLLVSTSDPVGLERLVDRVLVLRAGRLVLSAPAAALLGGRVLEVILDAPPAEPPPGFRVTPTGLETDLGRGTAEAALAVCRAHRIAVRASRVRLKTLDEATLDPLDTIVR